MILFNFAISLVLVGEVGPDSVSPTSYSSGSVKALGLRELVQSAESSSPLLEAANLDVKAARAKAWQSWGQNLPELGVEGGGISDREREKRNDYFGYAYGELRFSPESLLSAQSEAKSAKLEETKARLGRYSLLARVSELYFDWLKYSKMRGLAEEHLKTTRAQIQMARRQLQAGRATEVDIQQFQIHEKELQKLLLLIEHEQEEATEALRIILGSDELMLKAEEFKLSETQIEHMSPGSNLHLEMAEAASQKAQFSSLARKMSWLPEFEASAKYGRLENTDFVESRNDSWEVIGLVRIPLFRGGNNWSKASETSARAKAESLRFQYSKASLKNRLRLRAGHLKTLLKQEEIESESAAIAREFYASSTDQYKRGVKTASELGEASDRVFDSRRNLIELEREIHRVRLEVAKLRGESVLWLIE